jgi:hypothetical protein
MVVVRVQGPPVRIHGRGRQSVARPYLAPRVRSKGARCMLSSIAVPLITSDVLGPALSHVPGQAELK